LLTESAPTKSLAPGTIASYLLPVMKALDSRGVDSRALVARAGISPAVSNDPLARLPYHQMGEVFRLATEATGDLQFGLYASRFMLPAHIHALGSALLASQSLMDVCRRIERYGAFLAQTVVFYVERGEMQTKIGAQLKVPLRTEALDMFWSFVLRFMRHLGTDALNPEHVEFSCEESAGTRQAYAEFFRCKLTFGHEEMALYFDTATLEQPLPTASVELAQLSDQVVKEYLAKMDKNDIVSRVSGLLIAGLPAGNYTKEDAAQALHISTRTLQKRLTMAGTTWRELLDRTRCDLAVSYLECGRYNIAEITYMLGFNDSSSFSRAFKRWTGEAPGKYSKTGDE
jgi:AraC-like DNA-binding protein